MGQGKTCRRGNVPLHENSQTPCLCVRMPRTLPFPAQSPLSATKPGELHTVAVRVWSEDTLAVRSSTMARTERHSCISICSLSSRSQPGVRWVAPRLLLLRFVKSLAPSLLASLLAVPFGQQSRLCSFNSIRSTVYYCTCPLAARRQPSALSLSKAVQAKTKIRTRM